MWQQGVERDVGERERDRRAHCAAQVAADLTRSPGADVADRRGPARATNDQHDSQPTGRKWETAASGKRPQAGNGRKWETAASGKRPQVGNGRKWERPQVGTAASANGRKRERPQRSTAQMGAKRWDTDADWSEDRHGNKQGLSGNGPKWERA